MEIITISLILVSVKFQIILLEIWCPKSLCTFKILRSIPYGSPIANPLWGLGFLLMKILRKYYRLSLTIGLSIAIVGVLISIPLIFVLFDIISRVFINWLLFISFPLIPRIFYKWWRKKNKSMKGKIFW